MWGRLIKSSQADSKLATILPMGPSATGKMGYLILADGEAAVIDCMASPDRMMRALRGHDATLRYLLVTHAHPGRVAMLPAVQAACGGLFGLHAFDQKLLAEALPGTTPDMLLGDGQVLPLGAVAIRVLHTPGHTQGALSFYLKSNNALFTGSTLVKGGYGQIWGPKSMSLMVCSLKRLNNNFYGKTKVYPGVGDATTMGAEGWVNYLRSA